MERKVTSRRRGEELEQAILEAVWLEFQEGGFAKLSMEGVAKRAGTSKPVLYRRWPNRLEMMIACAAHRMPTADSLRDTGSLRDDTIELLTHLRKRMLLIGSSAILGMLSEISNDPEGRDLFVKGLVQHLLTLTDVVIDRAVTRGELRPEALTERLRRVPIDLARNEFLITSDLPDAAIHSIVDEVYIPALQGNGALVTT
ncbi:TetR/AcrR family transcriptional regulator [Glycomyces harbinensis]|uniref:Transcriptional regulator, TetR family n=1 Tax=Glycomyces harbinensis TaxID=58114 RepID=A0A1G7DWG2_9ACTN|nr:TetR/AcrR family transcriptional regulator [Glycomyces harbinensis]SDE55771.1 transcriptional regulator, TetR family [Glycomyces harbinensis]